MANKVIVGSKADSKAAHVVSTESAGAPTIGAGELGIYIGTDVVATNNQRCISALQQLRDALREANFPVGPQNVNFAHVIPPDGKQGITIDNATVVPGLTELHVVIGYGNAFESAGNSQTFVGHIDRLIETFQEKILKLT